MNILAIIRKNKPETSAEISTAHNTVIDELNAEREALEALESQRDDMVLDGTETQIDDADREIALAERRIRDLDVARARLAERHQEALKREQLDAMHALQRKASDLVDKQVETIRNAAKHMKALLHHATAFHEAEVARQQLNQQMTDAGFRQLRGPSAWQRAVEAGWKQPETHSVVDLSFPGLFIKSRAHLEQLISAAAALKK